MNREIVPGCLVLIVGCVSNPVNIGKTAVAVERAPIGHVAKDGSVFADGVEGEAWYLEGDGLSTVRIFGATNSGFSYALASHLMPIYPEAEPATTTQQEQTA